MKDSFHSQNEGLNKATKLVLIKNAIEIQVSLVISTLCEHSTVITHDNL